MNLNVFTFFRERYSPRHPFLFEQKIEKPPFSAKNRTQKTNRLFACLLRRINIITLFIILAITQVNATSWAQQITLKRQQADMTSILKDIENLSGYNFFYKKADIENLKEINVNFQAIALAQALDNLLPTRGLTYEFFEKTIVIKKKTANLTVPKIKNNSFKVGFINQQHIVGKILDAEGKPVPGATLRIKSKPKQVQITDAEGRFYLPNTFFNQTIVISYMGYEKVEFKATPTGKELLFHLKALKNEVDEVVVTGMMEFKKSSFSGASSAYKLEELKQVTNTNIIQALKTLDPSFLVMENNLSGANPNVLPTIELRGQTSITSENLRDEFTDDPNQPLFILDGFQSSLRTIMDLDMNRIESINILKDASATAIYGSRASNGVVVVETIKPKPGELRLNYTTDMNLETAALSSYNMMNAAEKLEFERLSGIYTADESTPEAQRTYYDPLYNSKLEKVLSGVDSYWLKTPIRTGFAHRQSLYVEGGSENFIFNVGGNFKNNNAVMKGSGRQEWGARSNMIYRKNQLSAINNFSIQGNKSEESNFGSFSTWVNMNPYYSNVDPTNSTLETYKDHKYNLDYITYNPLYNTQLNSFDRSKGLEFVNNFQLTYDLSDQWRFSTSFQVKKGTSETDIFKSPLHLDFIDRALLSKGTYHTQKKESFSYTANVMAAYAKTIDKNTFNANLRIEFSENNNKMIGFTAMGFLLTSNGNPAFAYGYDTNGSPTAHKAIHRRNSLIAAFTYSYDNRYNADVSFNYDGSTAFGRQNTYSPFFATGLSWNLHNEAFLKDNPFVSQLRVRANYGVTGNQNFNSSSSISTYNYLSAYNYYGQGITLASFANENLRWQKTHQLSGGIDATLLQNRLTFSLNAYQKRTYDLAVAVDLPASTGLLGYPFNAGDLTVKGLELSTRYNVIHRPADRFVWNVGLTGARSKQTYNNFNNLLNGLNQTLQKASVLQRYMDGYSPSDLWAVKSLGIDPAMGREIFEKKDGTKTFNYDPKDIVSLGNKNPKLQGILSTSLHYKGFSFNAYMRYIWDKDVFNTALFNKVENISLTSILRYNQDRRALYERWQNPGDIAQFRSISLSNTTQASSRFIQQENSVSMESISLGYEFRDQYWLKSLGLNKLKITGISNEPFHWSSVRRERGIDYPYAKMYSLSINANF